MPRSVDAFQIQRLELLTVPLHHVPTFPSLTFSTIYILPMRGIALLCVKTKVQRLHVGSGPKVTTAPFTRTLFLTTYGVLGLPFPGRNNHRTLPCRVPTSVSTLHVPLRRSQYSTEMLSSVLCTPQHTYVHPFSIALLSMHLLSSGFSPASFYSSSLEDPVGLDSVKLCFTLSLETTPPSTTVHACIILAWRHSRECWCNIYGFCIQTALVVCVATITRLSRDLPV